MSEVLQTLKATADEIHNQLIVLSEQVATLTTTISINQAQQADTNRLLKSLLVLTARLPLPDPAILTGKEKAQFFIEWRFKMYAKLDSLGTQDEQYRVNYVISRSTEGAFTCLVQYTQWKDNSTGTLIERTGAECLEVLARTFHKTLSSPAVTVAASYKAQVQTHVNPPAYQK